ncbi:ABC transporter substrate-binding protein [Paenibacillus piri]|uniref:Sugar ABC transporter substrate-binding protein n=1 Tax=Paenibacillus piri TaxID=2547395 RepID=A0A4R5KKP9_9BACL|nr:sugar ABC transporter substrate-binding protein [Paenibacillus piri]TDF95435.1 sugar ABC transporter substrate-binding protein [Paenibacillus piri]
MKKKLMTATLITLSVSMVFGCSNNNATGTTGKKEQKKTLTVWMKKLLVEDQNKLFVERAKQFGVENNADVNIELIATDDFYPKWTAAIESGNVPDVTQFGYQVVGEFQQKGLLADISDVVKRIEEKNGPIYETMKKAITYDGKQYALPYWAEGTVLFYRKDILKNAGFDGPPKTWEEFRKIAKAVTDSSKGLYGAGIGFGKNDTDAEWQTRAMIWSYGGSLDTSDGKTVKVNSPETIEAAKLIRDIFITDKSTPPSALGWDDSGNNKAYLSGQVAMTMNVGSLLNSIKKDNPELYNNTGLAMLPAGPKGTFIPGISNNLGIFKNAKNPELAGKFLEYVADASWYKTWVEKGVPLAAPMLTKLADEPIWNDYKIFVDSTKSYTFLGYPGGFNPKSGEVYNLRYVNETFQEMLGKNIPPEKAMQDLQTKIEEVFKK